jgi:hypothetical protein
VLGQSLTIAAALVLARGRRGDAKPFLVLALLFLAQIAGYVLLWSSAGWRAMLAAFGASPALPGASAAAALALGTLILAWRRVPPRARPGAPVDRLRTDLTIAAR